ncbi:hypothetical protein [Bradyrhizobium zhanjiangense]|uniref:Uncharacterized protein n=1 Tax=Bradyrhizobium zhanjiangense TaxID=1325107 RepID=A0A4Q0SFL7_9BRAD|nr:hypothetical protein [Bradyrhizobium zhanjiangense]RXH37952.1 hypothetical protein XH94_23825 [Bradyrhizobium zhanjiangense]
MAELAVPVGRAFELAFDVLQVAGDGVAVGDQSIHEPGGDLAVDEPHLALLDDPLQTLVEGFSLWMRPRQ